MIAWINQSFRPEEAKGRLPGANCGGRPFVASGVTTEAPLVLDFTGTLNKVHVRTGNSLEKTVEAERAPVPFLMQVRP